MVMNSHDSLGKAVLRPRIEVKSGGDTKSSNERQNLKFQPAKRRSTKGNRALLHRSVGVVGVVEGELPVPAGVLGCLKVQNT